MNKLKTTKYMDILTPIGFIIGFGIIIWYSVTGGNPLLVVIGLIIIFLARTIGYGIDRIIELKDEKKN